MTAAHSRTAHAVALALTLLAAQNSVAWAWKPSTHIYLADRALREVQNGRMPIYRVDRQTGAVLGKVGDYKVDSVLFAGIQANRKIFNAGVLGPDAYPDLVTGQTIVHPDVAHDEGSNSWLEYLWDRSLSGGPKVRAFVTGYLFHAAGDMYAHTYMNHYSGGDFAPGCNALRHLTLEGYIGKKTPVIAAKEFSIRATAGDNTVRDFIVEHLIKAPLGSTVENRLLVSSEESMGSYFSVPRIYSRLRNRLVQESAELAGSHGANDPLAPVKRAYIQAWIADIDAGLRAWPMVSEKLAGLLVYNLDETMSSAEMKEQIRATLNDYVNQHLLSMSGAPDFVGLTRAQIQEFTEAMLGPLEDEVQALVDDLTNTMVKAVTGYTLDEITDYLKRPELRFDPILGPGAPRDETCAGGASLTRSTFDSSHLQLEPNGQWKLASFPPAYNTVLMTKLILLEKSEVNRLIADLRRIDAAALTPSAPAGQLAPRLPGAGTTATTPLPGSATNLPSLFGMREANAMLGFQRKLDGSNQWRRNGPTQQMALARSGVYEKIFLKQLGEDTAQVAPPAPLPAGAVKVTITRAHHVDDVDPGPGQGEADFYGWIQIDDKFRSFGTIENDNDVSPSWTLSNEVVANTVSIKIRLYDEDTGLAAPDDMCDIDPRDNKRGLDLTYDLRTGRISGDASGQRGTVITVRGAGDTDRCEISFKIEGP